MSAYSVQDLLRALADAWPADARLGTLDLQVGGQWPPRYARLGGAVARMVVEDIGTRGCGVEDPDVWVTIDSPDYQLFLQGTVLADMERHLHEALGSETIRVFLRPVDPPEEPPSDPPPEGGVREPRRPRPSSGGEASYSG